MDNLLLFAVLTGVLCLGLSLAVAERLGVSRHNLRFGVLAATLSVVLIVFLNLQTAFLERYGLYLTLALIGLYLLVALFWRRPSG